MDNFNWPRIILVEGSEALFEMRHRVTVRGSVWLLVGVSVTPSRKSRGSGQPIGFCIVFYFLFFVTIRDQPTVPAFTQLFLDKKNMLAWSEFISLSEEQQEEYLKELNRNDYREEEENGVEDKNER